MCITVPPSLQYLAKYFSGVSSLGFRLRYTYELHAPLKTGHIMYVISVDKLTFCYVCNSKVLFDVEWKFPVEPKRRLPPTLSLPHSPHLQPSFEQHKIAFGVEQQSGAMSSEWKKCERRSVAAEKRDRTVERHVMSLLLSTYTPIPVVSRCVSWRRERLREYFEKEDII